MLFKIIFGLGRSRLNKRAKRLLLYLVALPHVVQCTDRRRHWLGRSCESCVDPIYGREVNLGTYFAVAQGHSRESPRLLLLQCLALSCFLNCSMPGINPKWNSKVRAAPSELPNGCLPRGCVAQPRPGKGRVLTSSCHHRIMPPTVALLGIYMLQSCRHD